MLINITCFNASTGEVNFQQQVTSGSRGCWSSAMNIPFSTNAIEGAAGPDYCNVTWANTTAAATALGCSVTPCSSNFTLSPVTTPLVVRP